MQILKLPTELICKELRSQLLLLNQLLQLKLSNGFSIGTMSTDGVLKKNTKRHSNYAKILLVYLDLHYTRDHGTVAIYCIVPELKISDHNARHSQWKLA